MAVQEFYFFGSYNAFKPFKIKVFSGADSKFTIPTAGTGYDYSLKVAGVVDVSGLTGAYTINFPSANTDYVLEIYGLFPWWYQNFNAERFKVKETIDCGGVILNSFQNSFYGSENLVILNTFNPNLSTATNMAYSLGRCGNFNSNVNHWDVSNIQIMNNVFWMNYAFNQPLNSWNVGNVTNMQSLFEQCSSFNQPLNSWNVGNVTNMQSLFYGANLFNQDLSGWDVSSVTNMVQMFCVAQSFKQDLSSWDVSGVTNFASMFNQGGNVTGISNWDMSSATSVSFMFYANPRFNVVNGNNVIKLNTSSNLTDISGILYGQGPYTDGITDFEITDCSGVTNATNAFENAFGVARLILTNIGVSFDISSTALTGIEIDNLADSVADLTGLPSQTCNMGATKIASCDTSKWALKNWTLI